MNTKFSPKFKKLTFAIGFCSLLATSLFGKKLTPAEKIELKKFYTAERKFLELKRSLFHNLQKRYVSISNILQNVNTIKVLAQNYVAYSNSTEYDATDNIAQDIKGILKKFEKNDEQNGFLKFLEKRTKNPACELFFNLIFDSFNDLASRKLSEMLCFEFKENMVEIKEPSTRDLSNIKTSIDAHVKQFASANTFKDNLLEYSKNFTKNSFNETIKYAFRLYRAELGLKNAKHKKNSPIENFKSFWHKLFKKDVKQTKGKEKKVEPLSDITISA